jgi:serine/threonine protein kinase/Tol biopolymer transport system component/tetratricopeptide (TPR) repeat protein
VSPERWTEVKAIFESASDVAPSRRAAFLDQRCGADAELRAEVDSLLDAHENTGGFLEDIREGVPEMEPDSEPETAPIGARIGAYELVRELGRGGMGSVYLATRADSEFRKRVAIKLIRHGMESAFALRRFRNERQILARLEHPNIARLLDGGTTEKGLPYFVMELVEGQPILKYCDGHGLSITARLEIFHKVCSAVQYAHRRTIIHRDLKPANILVKNDGTPKLLDFGVAKFVDPDTSDILNETTLVGVRMVTPAYASPEQLRGEQATVRSDIYSLGVILCELVAGCKPAALAAAASGALLTPVRNDIHPSRLGDLRHIIDRASNTVPEGRYASVDELMRDVSRYLSGLPVTSAVAIEPRPLEEPTGAGSIAVLPFRLLDQHTTGDAFLTTGIADAIITRLSGVGRISVRPTSAVLRYAEAADAVAVGYELGVEFVLEGTVHKAGNRVGLRVQLVRVRAAAPVWAGNFETQADDLLQIEDRIASQVAEAVLPQLTGEEREQLAKAGTESATAHDSYLRGRYYWNKNTADDLARSLLCFMQAVVDDPQYALAHAGIADYYIQLGVWGGPPPSESFAAAKDSAQRALDIDPNLAEAHASYGFAVWALDRDHEEAAYHLQMAITLKPDYPTAHLWFGLLNVSRGKLPMAIASHERARRLDPRSPKPATGLALAYTCAREYGKAIEDLRGPRRAPDEHYSVEESLAWAYIGAGRNTEALDAAKRAVTLSDRNPFALCALAAAESAVGNRRAAALLTDEVSAIEARGYVSRYLLASMNLAAGRTAPVFPLLAKAREDRDWWTGFLAVDPRWDSIRSDPRFGAAAVVRGTEISPPAVARSTRRSRKRLLALAAVAVAAMVQLVYLARLTFLRPPSAPFEKVRVTKLTTNGTATRAAISDNGSMVAYTGTQDGKLGLWVKPLEHSTATRIAGPFEADVTGLQFTSNGAYVSYVAYTKREPGKGTLYRVPISGGTPQLLMSEVPGPAALSRDGTRLAFLRPDPERAVDELVIANPDGTGARAVTARKYPDRFSWISGPAWSEDGTKIAIAVEGTDAQGYYVMLSAAHVATGKVNMIRQPRFQFVERIAWMKGGAGLVAIGQQEDSSFQQIWFAPYPKGQARRIGGDLNDYNGVSVSADGKSLVSVQVQTLSNIYVLSPGGQVRQITPGSGRYFDLAWGLGGGIVFASDASGSADIWAMDADGGNQRQLTSGKGRSYAPALSPDGKSVAFHSNQSGNWNVWRMDADGRNPVRMTSDKRDSNWPQFTPDGRYIMFHHTEPNALFNIWRVPAGGGALERLTTKLTMRPTLAADGRIGCWYSERSGSPTWKLAVLPPGGGDPLHTFDLAPGVAPDTPIRWTSGNDGLTFMGNRDGVTNLYTQPVSGGPVRQLTPFSSGQIYSFDWSRDGRLAYSRGMSSSDVILMRDAPGL